MRTQRSGVEAEDTRTDESNVHTDVREIKIVISPKHHYA